MSQEANPFWESVYVNSRVVSSLQALGESDRDIFRNSVTRDHLTLVKQRLHNVQQLLASSYKGDLLCAAFTSSPWNIW